MDSKKYPIPDKVKATAIGEQQYQKMYQQSISENDAFWAEQAEEFLSWEKKWDKVSNCDYCLLYTSPSPRDATLSRMPSSA